MSETELVAAQGTTATTSTTAVVKKEKKLKPARKQVKPGEVEKKEAVQTGKEYNIWYNKWAGGDREDSYSNKIKSQTRCKIKRDAGLTRANTTGMKYFCLFFARGCCPYGWECEYLHTLPDATSVLPDNSKDVFARDKFADYRDDMGGVGSFQRINRTLYIGRIKELGSGAETEAMVRRHFGEWGEIEFTRVLQYRSVAFVTYTLEVCAQFAKEAMACQSLDSGGTSGNDEILNVRWATEDPNPVSKVAEKRRLEDQGREAISKRMDPRIVDAMRAVRALEDGVVLDDEGHMTEGAPIDGEDENGHEPSAKRRRMDVDEDVPETPLEQTEADIEEVRAELGVPPAPNSLLSADALEGLKYFAQIRAQREAAQPAPAKVAPKPLAGMGVADYGSDDED